VVALIVILFPPLLIAFLLVMERVEEPLRRPASGREVSEFLSTATPGEVDTLARSVAAYLIAQAGAGAQALMIFDTWGGLLGPAPFREFSLRYMTQIVAALNADPASRELPVVLFSKGAGAHLRDMADTGCAALGVDWTIDLADARRAVAGKVALQGNLDPAILRASPEVIRREARVVLDSYGNHPGHVFNLGHGITPEVDPECVKLLVDEVHAYGRTLRAG